MTMRDPSTPAGRIIFMHIPKTGGTALHSAFLRAFAGTRQVFPYRFEFQFDGVEPAEHDFYSGHIGYDVAARIGGRTITVLRDPVDRVLSVYYFFRHLFETGAERNVKTVLAAQYDLPTFLSLTDNPYLMLELRNRMVWQLAGSCELPARQAYLSQGHREEALLDVAIKNLSRITIVGIDTNMDRIARLAREKLAVDLSIEIENVTPNRIAKKDIDPCVLQAAEAWVGLDRQLYAAAQELVRHD